MSRNLVGRQFIYKPKNVTVTIIEQAFSNDGLPVFTIRIQNTNQVIKNVKLTDLDYIND